MSSRSTQRSGHRQGDGGFYSSSHHQQSQRSLNPQAPPHRNQHQNQHRNGNFANNSNSYNPGGGGGAVGGNDGGGDMRPPFPRQHYHPSYPTNSNVGSLPTSGGGPLNPNAPTQLQPPPNSNSFLNYNKTVIKGNPELVHQAPLSHDSPSIATSQPLSPSLSWQEQASLVKWRAGTRTIANYKRIEQIGEGTYGQVYKAQCLSTGRIVAMKKIRLTNVGNEGLPRTVIREIKILKALRHPNMVEMIEVVSSKGYEHLDEEDERKDDKRRRERAEVEREREREREQKRGDHRRKNTAFNSNSEITNTNTCTSMAITNRDTANPNAAVAATATTIVSSSSSTNPKHKKDRIVDMREKYKGNLFLVLEYISHDLSGILDMGYRFTPVQSKCIFRQLLSVLKYMHEHRYVHRDLKSSNILVDSHFRVKLADFGLARSISPPLFGDNFAKERSCQEFTNKVVTLWYRPPELLLGETRYDEKVDIWSAGCILAELLLGKAIFPGKDESNQLTLIFETMGTPDERSWEGFRSLPKFKTGDVEIAKSLPSKFRDKYSKHNNMASASLNLIERLLEHNPTKRLRAERALESLYFRSQPIAPNNPAELGIINLGGDSHEFQTKPIRKEAKIVAQRASVEAKAEGRDEKEAYEMAYEAFLQRAAKDRDIVLAAAVDTNSASLGTGNWDANDKNMVGKKRQRDGRDRDDVSERGSKMSRERKENREDRRDFVLPAISAVDGFNNFLADTAGSTSQRDRKRVQERKDDERVEKRRYNYEEDRDKDRERERERKKDRVKDIDRDKNRDRDKGKSRDRDRDRDRNRDRDRDRNKDRDKVKNKDRDKYRERSNGRDRDRDKYRQRRDSEGRERRRTSRGSGSNEDQRTEKNVANKEESLDEMAVSTRVERSTDRPSEGGDTTVPVDEHNVADVKGAKSVNTEDVQLPSDKALKGGNEGDNCNRNEECNSVGDHDRDLDNRSRISKERSSNERYKRDGKDRDGRDRIKDGKEKDRKEWTKSERRTKGNSEGRRERCERKEERINNENKGNMETQDRKGTFDRDRSKSQENNTATGRGEDDRKGERRENINSRSRSKSPTQRSGSHSKSRKEAKSHSTQIMSQREWEKEAEREISMEMKFDTAILPPHNMENINIRENSKDKDGAMSDLKSPGGFSGKNRSRPDSGDDSSRRQSQSGREMDGDIPVSRRFRSRSYERERDPSWAPRGGRQWNDHDYPSQDGWMGRRDGLIGQYGPSDPGGWERYGPQSNFHPSHYSHRDNGNWGSQQSWGGGRGPGYRGGRGGPGSGPGRGRGPARGSSRGPGWNDTRDDMGRNPRDRPQRRDDRYNGDQCNHQRR